MSASCSADSVRSGWGRLRVESGDEAEDLAAGDTARYAADRTHAIRADAAARAILIVQDS